MKKGDSNETAGKHNEIDRPERQGSQSSGARNSGEPEGFLSFLKLSEGLTCYG